MARKTVGRNKRDRRSVGSEPVGSTTTAVRPPNESSRSRTGYDLWIAVVLAVVTLAVYAQVLGHQFISLDDDLYIRDNPVVARGLTLDGISWAFTTFHAANWHPLTWISHMVDCQLFGLHAGGHLLVNVLIHVANSLLVFFFLRRVTGTRWQSAIVAALFALHPLHVESVAWAAERKDTLSTFFGLLCLLAYAGYAAKPSWKKYLLVALWLALGLMAKPMLVTWPFVLLLLDYWPLGRLQWRPADGLKGFAPAWWPLIREKLPLVLSNDSFHGRDAHGAGPWWCGRRFDRGAAVLASGERADFVREVHPAHLLANGSRGLLPGDAPRSALLAMGRRHLAARRHHRRCHSRKRGSVRTLSLVGSGSSEPSCR